MRRIAHWLADPRLTRLEARTLLEKASGQTATWLLAHDDEALAPLADAQAEALFARRAQGEPIAYLLGWREFHGHRFMVTPDVLIPRPETELLVDEVLALAHTFKVAQGNEPTVRVLDLGTGSGCIACTLALAQPQWRFVATDVSALALAVALQNAQALGVHPRFEWRCADGFAALGTHEQFEIIVSNPPYIAEQDPHLLQGDLRFEPRSALTDGGDGLHFVRLLAQGAARHLAPQGHLLVEHGFDQGPQARALLVAAGLKEVRTVRDASGHERVAIGRQSSGEDSRPQN